MSILKLIFALSLTACSLRSLRENRNPPTNAERILQIEQEVSLAKDRDELAKFREEVPAERKQDNDDLALILDYFKDIRRDAAQIRNQFNQSIRSKQERYRKKVRELRDQYSKRERREREEFLRQHKQERDEFTKRQHDKHERDKFFADQDMKRKEFFANARDQRKEFEAQLQSSQKDQDAYFKEKRKIFTEEMRGFTERQRDWKKQERDKTRAAKTAKTSSSSLYPSQQPAANRSPLLMEFDELDRVPSQKLESE